MTLGYIEYSYNQEKSYRKNLWNQWISLAYKLAQEIPFLYPEFRILHDRRKITADTSLQTGKVFWRIGSYFWICRMILISKSEDRPCRGNQQNHRSVPSCLTGTLAL